MRTLRGRIIGIYLGLTLVNLGAWLWAVILFRQQPAFLATALLAYGFGLRHAVDADHIAAIDNVTRKLIQEGQRPATVGLWFAVGHSAVVALAAVAIAAMAARLSGRLEPLKGAGEILSTGVSALFLLIIAIVNFSVLMSVWQSWRDVRNGGVCTEADLEPLLWRRGLLARLFRPLFRIVTTSWQMLPLGFLFGLGFDTATEVALLGIAGTAAVKGVSIWSIMVFPALFAAGMSLIDTTDGILMLGAYQWAFATPLRKLFYNLSITAVSVLLALAIGAIEVLGLLADRLGLAGRFWDAIRALNGNFSVLGFAIIGIFIAAWIASIILYRYKGLGAAGSSRLHG